MKRIVLAITKYKVFLVVFSLLLTAFLGAGMTRLTYRSVLEGELPETDEIVQTNKQLKSVFGDKSYVVWVIYSSQGIINPAGLAKISQLSEDLRQFPGIDKDRILSLATFTRVEETSDGLEIKPLLETIPTTETELADFGSYLKSNPLIWRRLVSADLKATLITAPIDKATDEPVVFKAALALQQKYQQPEQIYSYSFQIINQYIDQGIGRDMSVLFPLAILIIAFLLYLSFGKIRAAFLPLLTMVLAIVSTMGLMGWLGFKISTVTSIIPVLIITLGSSYGIYIMEQYYSSPADPLGALSRVIKPLGLTCVVSAVGFFTLYVFKVDSIREFGFFAGAGLIFIGLYVLTFLVPLLGQPQVSKPSQFKTDFFRQLVGSLLKGIFSLSQQPKMVLTISLLLLVFVGWGISRLKAGSNPTKFFSAGHPLRQSSEIINQHFGGNGVVEIMFESSTSIIEPAKLQAIWQFQKYCESLNGVGYTYSVVDTLRYLNKTLKKTDELPASRQAANQYLLLYAMNKSVDLNTFLDQPQQRLKVTVWMNIDDSEQIETTYQQMRQYLAGNLPKDLAAKFGGENMEWVSQNHYIVSGKIWNIITSTLIIIPIFALIFRSLSLGFLTIVPITFSTFTVFGLMGWLGIRLDLASCILTSVTLGLGVDFAIHYLHHFQAEQSEQADPTQIIAQVNQQVGRPIVYDALANTLGFVVLLFSGFSPVRDFGWLIMLNMVICSLATLVFLPILVRYKSLRR